LAERRMFAKSVIESDAFLDLPISTRLLYFDLGMRGDDDGFVDSPKRVMRNTGASDDDFKLLIIKQFIIPFENGVVVIRHWKVHNYLRSDRYKPTLYQCEKSLISEDTNNIHFLQNNPGIPMVYQPSTIGIPNGSIGEAREGKERLVEGSEGEGIIDAGASPHTPYMEIAELYNSICISFPRVNSLSEARKKAIKARLNQYKIDNFKRLFETAEASNFIKGKNVRDWKAYFDWLIKDANMAKTLDDNYTDNRQTSAPTNKPQYGTIL
jgi:hypothetical protein